MPAALPLSDDEQDLVEQYCAEIRLVGLRPWRSTRSAAETFSRRLRNNGWEQRTLTQQLALVQISHAAPFASWLIVTGRLRVNARFVVAVGLRLGHAAALYLPVAYERFRQAAAPLETRPADVRLQWHALVLVAAAVGRTVDQIDDHGFTTGRAELVAAYPERDRRTAGRNPSAILHRLQTTLFHGEIIETIARPHKPGIRESGWRGIAVAYSEAAHR